MKTFDAFLSKSNQDALLSRRKSWNGVVVRDLHRDDEGKGHYYRVTDSHRDPETGEWWMYWSPENYLGATPPEGEPVYTFDGSTWDLPAVASTVFPWKWGLGLMAIFVFGNIAITGLWGGGNDEAGMRIGLATTCLFTFCWQWFYTVEPVRGTKALAAYEVAHVAHQISRANEPTFDERLAEGERLRPQTRYHGESPL